MPELGKKYECAECGAKFYDLGKTDPICPRCGTNQRDVEKAPAPEPRARFVAPARKPVAEVAVEPDDEVAVDEIGDDDDEILEVEVGEEEEEEDDDDDEG